MNFEDTMAQVHWTDLEHAYGVATDVPAMLRELKDPDIEDAVGVIIGGTVMHQGTRYSVTPHVIPCLVALLGEDDLTDQANVVKCFGWLAAWENEYLECGGDMEMSEGFEEDHALSLACYQAGVDELPLIKELAVEADELTRAMACSIHHLFRTEYPTTLPFFQERFEMEKSEMVRTALAMGIANILHETPSFEAAMRDIHDHDPSLLVRGTAAAMLAFCDMHDDVVMATLAEAVADEECMTAAEEVPFIEWYLAQEMKNIHRRHN